MTGSKNSAKSNGAQQSAGAFSPAVCFERLAAAKRATIKQEPVNGPRLALSARTKSRKKADPAGLSLEHAPRPQLWTLLPPTAQRCKMNANSTGIGLVV